MSDCKFKTGDRVRVVNRTLCGHTELLGKAGTVLEDDPIPHIRFDDYIYGHSCRHMCEEGHGWAVREKDLELVDGTNGHPDFESLTHAELRLHQAKNHDYAKGGDPLGKIGRAHV